NRDYDAYFSGGKPLRYSQVYATLSRLARDGKAVAGPVEQEAGPERRRYVITEVGIADVERWLAEPAPPEPDLQSELFAKVVLALMLDRPADSYLDTQRAAHLQRMRELTELKRDSDPLGVLLADHALYRLEADLRWIDHTAARLDLLARAVRRDRFGFVFQSGQLVPELTAEENVALPLLLCGTRRGPAMTAARKWFGTLGLDGLEHRRSGELSGGQAQRVALARGLVAGPE